MTNKQPNILFLMADQMAASALPMYGHKLVKTPNLDALAKDAVVFDSAYCNSPLCAPSRYVLMTGQLPSKINAFDNAADLPADIPTFAHYLRKENYQTALSGKMHFCGPEQLHGFEDRLTTDIYPADYGWFPNWDEPDTRPTWYHNMSSVTQAGPCVRTNQLDFDDEVTFQAKRYLHDYARGKQERPFCLTVSLTHPHDPYAIPQKYWDLYKDEEIELPKIDIPKSEQDPHSLRLQDVFAYDEQPVTEQQIKNARRAYYGAISYVDEKIGEILQSLKDCHLDEDTIIVFSGDHGDMLGERNLWYKMSFFEDSVRVPMLIHAPKRFSPKRVSQSVSTMDLLPTFVDMATNETKCEYAMPIQGRSLMPHLNGSSSDGHDEVIGEYFGEGTIAPLFMIRRGDYKYVYCSKDPDQLFNLKLDPFELNNLANDDAHHDCLMSFREEALARWDSDALTQAVLVNQRRRRLVFSALDKGRKVSWDHQPFFDSAEQYMRNHIDLDDLEAKSRYPKAD